jgi:hypothetical protein
MKVHKLGLLVFLLAGTVTAASSQENPAAAKTAATKKASDFKPALSVGKPRLYDRSSEAVATAVRDAMKGGQFQLLNEQTVESMTVFEAMVKSWRNMPARDKVRIVVDPLSEKSTAVRVSWPAAASFPPGSSGQNLYFEAIESRLK